MKKNIGYVVFYVFFIGLIIFVQVYVSDCLTKKEIEKWQQEMQEVYDQIDREFAIMELSELHGRVNEIQRISWSLEGQTQEMKVKLRIELEEIERFESDNKYLSDFKLKVKDHRSDIDSICEEILTQIDEKKKDIW